MQFANALQLLNQLLKHKVLDIYFLMTSRNEFLQGLISF